MNIVIAISILLVYTIVMIKIGGSISPSLSAMVDATKHNSYNPTKHSLLLAEVDLRPDYVKEYEAEVKAKRPKHVHEIRYDVVEFDEIINLLTIHYRDGVKGNTNVSILPKSFADGLEDD